MRHQVIFNATIFKSFICHSFGPSPVRFLSVVLPGEPPGPRRQGQGSPPGLIQEEAESVGILRQVFGHQGEW